jgi:hypothetical protein
MLSISPSINERPFMYKLEVHLIDSMNAEAIELFHVELLSEEDFIEYEMKNLNKN